MYHKNLIRKYLRCTVINGHLYYCKKTETGISNVLYIMLLTIFAISLIIIMELIALYYTVTC